MNDKSNMVGAILLGVALVGILIFLGAFVVMGGTTIGGNIALGLAVVALIVYVYLRPQEVAAGLQTRQARYGGNTLLMTALFIGILVAVNFLSMRNSKRWDLTAEQRYSLSPETVGILKGLQQPVTAINFSAGRSGGARSETGVLLDEYKAQTNKFTVETVDPDAQPTLARQYLADDGMIVLIMGERHVTVNSPTESDITAGLIKVIRTTQPVVYYTTGHGERDMDDGRDTGFSIVKAALNRDGFEIKPLMLATTSTVPADASLVLVGGPHAPLSSNEVEVLRSYASRGGRLLVMVDTSLDTPDRKLGDAGLGPLFSDFGITLRNDVVFDPLRSQVTDPLVIYAAEYGASPITDKLGNMATGFLGARSIATANPAPANVSLVDLVKTSNQAWSVTDLESVVNGLRTGRVPGPGAQDARGQLTLAVTASRADTSARLVVIGSSAFAVNAMSQVPGNLDLFLNGANWLAEQESQMTIRPKPFTTRQLIPTRMFTVQVMGISLVLMPLAVLVCGAIVWWRRR